MMQSANYPVPFYNRKPNTVRTQENEQLDFGWSTGTMSDGRSFYAEYWNEFGIDVVTYYFSTLGLENLNNQALIDMLVSEQLVRARVQAGEMREMKVTIAKKTDEAGREMWMVNVPFADEDEVWVDCLTPIYAYGPNDETGKVGETIRMPLFIEQGESVSIHIDVYIDADTGDLVIEGQDVGSFVKDMFGDSDYEYWLTIKKEHKHRLFELFAESDAEAVVRAMKIRDESSRDKALVSLIQKKFNVPDVVTKIREQCEARGIPCKFTSF